ncbi:beta-fructofuranosidase, insoluble isoenzyme 3-like [Zingiber officinale]|uniref:beta-fructofuranosidase, insoluble isoenzyme 3-like n=1 Tax=Zingiber officinale TaxID=94328 RepID=UPI001C4B54D3|nr:beta-fructofuranosidase, insoluble isoenzyme 3-like [Zingiber officinale]
MAISSNLPKLCLNLFAIFFFISLQKVGCSHLGHETLVNLSPSSIDSTLLPRYHFRPLRNWINDPNGPFYYKGIYHLFYQYNPYGSVWGNIVWGHSVSTDLINWHAVDPAIYPSKTFDIYGCWSGSATVLPGSKPVILYTGIVDDFKTQVQNIAFPANLSDPLLREWVKPDYNPVISSDPSINATQFRDPTTAWLHPDNKHWNVAIGSARKEGQRGVAILYRSRNFKNWTKAKHPLHSIKGTGMWECPDFFPVAVSGREGRDTSATGRGVKHVLKVSLDRMRFEHYTLGTYYPALDRYLPDQASVDGSEGLRYDYGNFYASKTFFDPAKKRRVLCGWANESDVTHDDASNDIIKGWAGVHLIPRELWLDENGRQLLQWPVEEFDRLRSQHVSLANQAVNPGGFFRVNNIDSVQADVEVTFEMSSLEKAEDFDPSYVGDAQAYCARHAADVKGGVGPFGLYVLADSALEERTAVFFKVFKHKRKHVVLFCHDPTRSTKRVKNIYKPTFAGFVDVDIDSSKTISLRSLIDHSVVESFGAGGKICITSRVYPSLAIGRDAHLFVFNNGAVDVKVSELNAWEIRTPFMNKEI